MNVPELERLAKHIVARGNQAYTNKLIELTLPPVFGRLMYHVVTESITKTGEICGTVGCIAGEYWLMRNGPAMNAMTIMEWAETELDLPNRNLFLLKDWPKELQAKYAKQERVLMARAIRLYITAPF